MMTRDDKVVLLFYKDFERDSFFKHDRYLKRIVRPIYHRLTHKQKVSGFFVSFQRLVTALRSAGYDVRINDYRYARKHPDHPVGIVGYPHILDDWSLPNPALLGPSLYDHPNIVPRLLDDPRYKLYLVLCDWMKDMFGTVYPPERLRLWFAGIDTTEWRDMASDRKDVDVLVYDKIRWNRETYVPSLLEPIVEQLKRRGLTHEIIRYKQYDHAGYKGLLSRSRSMVFLCEHETQGLAYQEALSANVPILAWENGFWLDPRRPEWEPEPVPSPS